MFMNIKLLVQPTEANMFGISLRSKSVARPLRTIEREVEATRARYNEYLKNTSSDYTAQRSNVTIKDPHTTGGAYQVLRGAINGINKVAQKANKKITFEDARVLTRNDEFASPSLEEKLSSKVLITVTDKEGGQVKEHLVDRFANNDVPFMKKISNALGEMFTGKKEANFDNELGLR